MTDGDWEELAHAALETLEFEVARLAFIKLQDFHYLELIQDLQVIFVFFCEWKFKKKCLRNNKEKVK